MTERRDVALETLLRQTVHLDRPVLTAQEALNPLAPRYERIGAGLRGLVQPERGTLEETAGGRLAEARHVGYLLPMAAPAPGDVLVLELAASALAERAEAGTETVVVQSTEFAAKQWVELGEGPSLERHQAGGSEGNLLTLARPTGVRHELGERVASVKRFVVVSVEDEAGQGHHWRVVLEEV